MLVQDLVIRKIYHDQGHDHDAETTARESLRWPNTAAVALSSYYHSNRNYYKLRQLLPQNTHITTTTPSLKWQLLQLRAWWKWACNSTASASLGLIFCWKKDKGSIYRHALGSTVYRDDFEVKSAGFWSEKNVVVIVNVVVVGNYRNHCPPVL